MLLSEAYAHVEEKYGSVLDSADYREIRVYRSNNRQLYYLRLAYDDPQSRIAGASISVFCIFRDDASNSCVSSRHLPPVLGPQEMIDPPLPELQRPFIEDKDEC